jgi:hypothetical protein
MSSKQINKILKTAGITREQFDSLITTARELGATGYKNGKRAPAQCKECLDLIKTNSGKGLSIPILDAWNNGWQREHFASTPFDFSN